MLKKHFLLVSMNKVHETKFSLFKTLQYDFSHKFDKIKSTPNYNDNDIQERSFSEQFFPADEQ